MHQVHHTLKHELTKTILLWSGMFFALLGVLLLLTFHSLEGFALDLMADHRSVETAIFSVTGWCAVLMILLVLTSIKALHVTLRRRLVDPVERLRVAVEDDHLDDDAIHALEDQLPEEAADILDVFEHLQHSADDMKSHLMDMMVALPACFWWSYDGQTYGGISEKCIEVLNQSPDDMTGCGLWAWTETSALLSVNNRQLHKAIQQHDERLDLAYEAGHGEGKRWFGESVMMRYDKQGHLRAVFGIINDISSRKKRQMEQAEQLESLRRMETTATLVGGIAHEFNNALAGMNGNVFLIKQSTDDPQTLNRIQRIEQLIERSASMIDSMLAFAKKSTLRPDPIDMVDFLQKFQAIALPSLPNHAQFNLNIDEQLTCEGAEPAVIRADRKKLQEVLMQLLQNADFSVQDIDLPRISIELGTLEADKDFLRQHPHIASSHLIHLQVQDNGCGIPEDILDRIFDPFFTTRDVGQGTGLGLSMSYGYIHQIGGAIEVDSAEGDGTILHIYLPRSSQQRVAKHQDKLLRGHGEHILVVDDDQVFRESTCEVLSRMGYQTIEAWDGKEAVECFEQHQDAIRLIFMDILMPGLTGIQASRRIRKIAPDIPIIFLTAYDRTQPLEPEVYEDNAELINKPFRISVLSQAIQKALYRHDNQENT